MTVQIVLVLVFTFIIYIISTFAYSVRIVGVRTGKIAVAFAVFNVFALVSRMANGLQAPFLSKRIESNINNGSPEDLSYIFRLILLSATAATILGALLMPTFIRLFTRSVEAFSFHRSVPRLIIHGFSKSGIEQFRRSIKAPESRNLKQIGDFRRIPKKIVLLNALAFSISTVGGLASLYAGSKYPELRTTCSVLSSVVNMFATLSMFIMVDPYISLMTDDVLKGSCSSAEFDRMIVFLVAGLICGTILAQALLVPLSELIRLVAVIIPA
jgi:hypothetical protein